MIIFVISCRINKTWLQTQNLKKLYPAFVTSSYIYYIIC